MIFYCREQRDPTEPEHEAMPVLVHTAALLVERYQEMRQRANGEQALRAAQSRPEASFEAGEVGTWFFAYPKALDQ